MTRENDVHNRREMCPEMSDDNESWDNQRFGITLILI